MSNMLSFILMARNANSSNIFRRRVFIFGIMVANRVVYATQLSDRHYESKAKV